MGRTRWRCVRQSTVGRRIALPLRSISAFERAGRSSGQSSRRRVTRSRSGIAALEGRRQEAIDHAVEAPGALVDHRSPLRIRARGDRCVGRRRSVAAVAGAAFRDGAGHPRGARCTGAGRSAGSDWPRRRRRPLRVRRAPCRPRSAATPPLGADRPAVPSRGDRAWPPAPRYDRRGQRGGRMVARRRGDPSRREESPSSPAQGGG